MEDIFYIKEEFLEEVLKIQLQHPYTNVDYNLNLFCPWKILSESAEGENLILISLTAEKHLLFNIYRKHLISMSDMRNIKIDKIL